MASAETQLRLPLLPLELAAAPCTVCVTGASGYIASEIIIRLLAAGHTVHGTVRGEPTAPRFAPLHALPGAAERLKLFTADLSVIGSFDSAVAGCEHVLHVASPVSAKVRPEEAQAQLVRPAVQGVENVVAAVEKAGCVKTVVLTSSMTAVVCDNWERGRDHTYTEADWEVSASESFFPYALSKTLAERRAWELHAAQPSDAPHKWRLVALLPSYVLGPPPVPGNSELVDFAVKLMRGELWPAMPNVELAYVDLADVAAAHVVAMLKEDASGRFLLSAGEGTMGMQELVKAVRPRFPRYRLPFAALPRWVLWIACTISPDLFPWDVARAALGKPMRLDGGRAVRELGLRYNDPVEAMAAMMQGVVDVGLAPRR